MNAFFDLDGTLVDISDRWYALHQDMTARNRLPALGREAYIAQKRDGVPEETIMGAVSTDVEAIKKYCIDRVAHIEDAEYLLCDILYADTPTVLQAWKSRYSLTLVTARHDKDALAQELERLGISDYFSSVLVTQGEDKSTALSKLPQEERQDAPFISDSHEDYQVAAALGMRPIAVSYGCRSKEFLIHEGIFQPLSSAKELIALASERD